MLKTPVDVGATIREHRNVLGLTQAQLADKIGVTRQWVIEIEQGKPRAELGLVMRALNALGIVLRVDDGFPAQVQTAKETHQEKLRIDLNALIDKARKRSG